MTNALNLATQWFNQSVDPAHPIAQRGFYAPENGYPVWQFQTSPYVATDRLWFQGDNLTIAKPDGTQQSFYAPFNPSYEGTLDNEVANDLMQVTPRPPTPDTF
jgi:hypothetical protein